MNTKGRPGRGDVLGAWAALFVLAAMVTAISLAEEFAYRGPPLTEMAGSR